MKSIKFLGASGTVTGSSYLLDNQNTKLLIDLGLFQGTKEIDELNFLPIEFNPRELTAAILTHAHLDHCGRLPLLVKNGFNKPIFMTPSTRELTELALFDSARIAQGPDGNGLYDEFDVSKLISLFRTVDYHEKLSIGDQTLEMYDAGHLLGSASLDIWDKESKVIFSGDLGNTPQDIIKPTEFITRGDFVIMESTYGGKSHPTDDPKLVIQKEINAVEANRGVLLIPAFALERTQTLLHIIGHLKQSGKVKKDTPIFLDSPMAIKATKIFGNNKELFNEEMVKLHSNNNPFSFPGLQIIENNKESDKLRMHSGPMVIIAGSGMMTGGRILKHSLEFLSNSANRLLIVGYQGDQTLGREILDGERLVQVSGETLKINASVTDTQSLSSHADQPKLINWLSKLEGISKVFLTHGEDEPRAALKQEIAANLAFEHVEMPVMNQIFSIKK